MSAKSSYLTNKLIDWFWRGQTFAPPATLYFGLLTTTNGLRSNSTAYALNNTISVVANDGKTHLYKCTTAGTTAAAQSTLYPGVANEVIVDGTATFTEQNSALKSNTGLVEVSGTGYARVGVVASLANFAGTQAAASTTVSTGTNGTTSNNGTITFGSPTSTWGNVWAIAVFDASTAGNLLEWGGLSASKTINNGDAAPSIAISAFTSQEDN